MTFGSGQLLSLPCGQCSQCHALIQLDIITDFCCLTDNNTCTVVDKEIAPDSGTGVDIDPSLAMGLFCHNTRYKRYILNIQFMGNSVNIDSK